MELQVTIRTQRGKDNKKMRRTDQVPAIVYAKHIDEPIAIAFRRQDFVNLYKLSGKSTPVTLKGDGIDEMVLIHDMQIDPVTNFVLHVDFLGIKKGEKVATDVPLILQGSAPVTKSGEARLQQIKDTLHIQAVPKDLPHEIFVDVTGLETTHDALFVRDLPIPKGVEVLDDESLSVVIVADLSGAGEEEEEAEATPTEPAA